MTIVSVWVSVTKGVSVVVVSISLRGSLSSSSGLSLSLPLAIVVSMAIGVRISMVSMDGGDYRVVGIGKTMAIAIVGISLSLGGYGGEQTQSNDCHGFHHIECLQARGF